MARHKPPHLASTATPPARPASWTDRAGFRASHPGHAAASLAGGDLHCPAGDRLIRHGILCRFAAGATRIAVGPADSDDLRLIQFLGAKFAKDKASIRLRLIATESSAQSAEALDAARAELAIVRHDLAFPKNAQVVAVLRKNYAVLFAPGEPLGSTEGEETGQTKSTKIEKIEDLAGKRIGVIGRSQANIELLKVILSQYEVPFDQVHIVTLPVHEVGGAIRAAEPDAILTVGPLSSRITTDAIAALTAITPNWKPPTFLPIGSSEAIAERFPAYERTQIAKGAFGGAPSRPSEEIETVMVSHYVVAANSTTRRRSANWRDFAVVAANAVVRTDRFRQNREARY